MLNTLKRTSLLRLAALAILATATTAAFAQETLYAIEYNALSDLFEVDQTNGSFTSVGAIGLDNLGDLTSDTRAGSETLWANRILSNELIELNPATGGVLNTVALDSEDSIVSIAFDVVSGKLYGNTSTGYGAPFEALYEIDPVSGNTTFIGRITFDDVFALGFDQSGTLYGVSDASNQLISISTVSGNGAAIAFLQADDIFDLASRPSDNTVFVTDAVGDRLWTIDTGNGALTDVGPETGAILNNAVGLAFIPEPATLSMMVFGGLALLRRRR